MTDADTPLGYIRSARAVRDRAETIFAAGSDASLEHFTVELDKLPEAARRVTAATRSAYPQLEIPYHSRWNHFGSTRRRKLEQRIASFDDEEKACTRLDLVVTSVLLDAGAGSRWCYREPGGETPLSRSEGLAVASFHMFLDGAFGKGTLRATAEGLRGLTGERLATGFQVTADNPLEGLPGRLAILQGLGRTLGSSRERVADVFRPLLVKGSRLPAGELLRSLLEHLGDIWPGRLHLDGQNLGDVWRHPRAGGEGPTAGLVPFHKLSQWLTYSLIEPFEAYGVEVTGLDELTGLAEYRNGGLFIDTGVLSLTDRNARTKLHRVDSEIVVEWRALTVALLDRLAERVRHDLGLDQARLPLAKVLEGGSWSAGRALARELRPDGSPPLRVESDGTVF